MSEWTWEPVEDGRYDVPHTGDSVDVEDDWLVASCALDGEELTISLPDDLRLCRRVPAAPSVPVEVPDVLYEDVEWLLLNTRPDGPTNAVRHHEIIIALGSWLDSYKRQQPQGQEGER